MLGGEGVWTRPARAARGGRPRRRPVVPGPDGRLRERAGGVGVAADRARASPIGEPVPLFAKLDPSVVEEELARLDADASASVTARAERGRRASRRRPRSRCAVAVADSHCHLDIMGGDVAGAARRGPGRRHRHGHPGRRRRRRPRGWPPSSRREHDERLGRGRAAPQRGRPRRGHRPRRCEEIAALAAAAAGEGGRRDRASTTSAPGPRARGCRRSRSARTSRSRRRRGKALVIHDRDAHDDVLRVLHEEGAPDDRVFHCFSGDAAMARVCADAGYYLSFAGPVTFKPNDELREAAVICPAGPAAGRDRRARSSPRCRSAGGPTRPTWCRSPCGRWRRPGGRTSTSSAPPSRRTAGGPSTCPGAHRRPRIESGLTTGPAAPALTCGFAVRRLSAPVGCPSLTTSGIWRVVTIPLRSLATPSHLQSRLVSTSAPTAGVGEVHGGTARHRVALDWPAPTPPARAREARGSESCARQHPHPASGSARSAHRRRWSAATPPTPRPPVPSPSPSTASGSRSARTRDRRRRARRTRTSGGIARPARSRAQHQGQRPHDDRRSAAAGEMT